MPRSGAQSEPTRTEIAVVICIALMSLIPHRRRRTRRQRARVDLDHALRNAHAVGELLGERRRRAAVLQPVLVAMPRAGHAAVDDAPLADRPILVGAEIRECPDLRAVAEDCDAFAIRRRDDAGSASTPPNTSRRPDRFGRPYKKVRFSES